MATSTLPRLWLVASMLVGSGFTVTLQAPIGSASVSSPTGSMTTARIYHAAGQRHCLLVGRHVAIRIGSYHLVCLAIWQRGERLSLS